MNAPALHVHVLAGCAPSPLAHYLKAFGVLRLVAEQADEHARGFWRDETFRLVTSLDREALESFFRKGYQPTPLIAPWNGGSGFYPRDRKVGIDAIAGSRSPRLAAYREAIHLGRELTEGLSEAPKSEEKTRLMRTARGRASREIRAWLDAAYVITGDGDPKYPALLGTGGNDGRLDFTNNFMQRLAELFDLKGAAELRPEHRALLSATLWGTPTPGLAKESVGQFLPGGAGGPNSSEGFMGASLVNPWDFILMLEGAVMFRSSVVRRSAVREAPKASAPFAIHADPSGYASAHASDKNRGEQWMPLWSRPSTVGELARLLAEGRSQLGRGAATRPLDFARAVSRLGVARGITAFERYSYIERNGQANLATPLGRWVVSIHAAQDLLDDVAPWLDRLRRIAADKHAPASFQRAARLCDNSALACCRPGDRGQAYCDLLIALGRAERLAVSSPRFAGGQRFEPLPPLRAGWIRAAGIDDLCEGRLAMALASLHGLESSGPSSDGGPRRVVVNRLDPVRRHWLPLDEKHPRKFRVFADSTNATIALGPEQVCHGHDLIRDLLALLTRRAAGRGAETGTFGLIANAPVRVRLADIAAFLAGSLDDALILELATPLMALDWRSLRREHDPKNDALQARDAANPPAAFALLRLANPLSPPAPSLGAQRDGAPVNALPEARLDPAGLARLAAGDLTAAGALARRRLLAVGRR
ncbi:MAG: type I-U CRISPR-associated protein Csx17, partial [Myxococcales bacterium]|nr:type I-U CRISPR-associated protein Csx17 [Myxococcales bacterium]